MATDYRPSSGRRNSYGQNTHRPLNALAMILPLLLLFQIGTAFYGTDLLAPRDIHRVLQYFGATAAYLPAILVVVVLLVQHAAHRGRWRVQPKVVAGMTGESVLWAVPIVLFSHVTGRPLAAQSGQNAQGLFEDILQGVGAGIYEEFIFRLVLISLIMLVLVDVAGLRRDVTAILAIAVSAVLFSLYHFSANDFADIAAFPWRAFVFRAIAGVYLGGLVITRGFGVAVGAHSFYNVYVAIVNAS